MDERTQQQQQPGPQQPPPETPRPDLTPPNVEPEVKDDDQPKYDGGPIPRVGNDLDALKD